MKRLYDSTRWRKARRRFLQTHPLCALCLARGILEVAEVVDHIIPHKGDPTLFWNEGNWQSCSKRCHDSRKAMIERGDKIEPHSSWRGVDSENVGNA